MTTNETFRLVSVTDLRGIDFASGKRLPLEDGEGHECDRCGRLHAVVFTFAGDRGTTMRVGSGCATKDLGVPSKELARAERKATEDAIDTARELLVTSIRWFVNSLPAAPEPALLGTASYGGEIFGADGVEIRSLEGLTIERRRCFARAWVEKQVRAAFDFRGFTSYEILAAATK